MKSKLILFGCTFLLSCTVLLHAAPKVGDSYEAVIAAKGEPAGRTSAGRTMLLSYPDVVVTLRDGKVTALKAVGDISTVPERKITDAERRAAAASLAPAATAPEWTTDADAALQRAQAENRKVFLFFTGSDWCGWCMRLNQEILSTPAFADYARQQLALVELDFPQRKAQPAALRKQNAALAQKYGIRGYPTVIVLDSSGQVVGRLGYQRGGPGPFVAALEKL